MSTQGYSLPATAVCPGCGELVVLPAEPPDPGTPPTLCSVCGAEAPDFRSESYSASDYLGEQPSEPFEETPYGETLFEETPFDETPLEDRRYSRGGLFRSLGGLVADRGILAVEAAKDRFNT